MTTIVGIKTNSGPIEAIVLGADTQLDFLDEDDKPVGKRPFYKIVCGDFFALAHAGPITDELRRFYNRLTFPERFKDYDKQKVEENLILSVSKKRFLEVYEINSEYYRETEDFDTTHEFLLAINKPQLNLFHVDPFGNIKEPKNKPYLALGTGYKRAEEIIESAIEGDSYESGNIDLQRALVLCRKALKQGTESDIFSGGPMDLVVIRKDRINQYGKRIKKEIEASEKKVFNNILSEEVNPEQKT
jgi:20S proteasome alpha/beta subunit